FEFNSIDPKALIFDLGTRIQIYRSNQPLHLGYLYLYSNREDRLGSQIGYRFGFGREKPTRQRAQHLQVAFGTAWLDERFSPLIDFSPVAIDGLVGWTYDSRIDPIFPLRGA